MLQTWKGLYTRLISNQTIRILGLTLYYLAIIIALIIMYGRGDFSTPPFIYQGF